MACVLLLAIPSSIIAEHQPRQGRQLLVVSKGKPAGETAVADTAKATSSGTLESTAGEDFNPPMVTKAEGKQEFPITKKSGTLQRKKGSKQSTQQQVLGSKGMPQMRQVSNDRCCGGSWVSYLVVSAALPNFAWWLALP